MTQKPIPEWQRQVEEIIIKAPEGTDAEELNNILQAILDIHQTVRRPEGPPGIVVNLILQGATQELYPMACAWAAFQLGVGYERYQHERSSGKP